MPRPYADIKVWLVDDCDYIAAATAEEARDYAEELGGIFDGKIEVIGPIDPTVMMHTCDDDDPDDEVISFAEAIYRHGQLGRFFPTLLASIE